MELKYLDRMHKRLAKRGNASSQIVASMAVLGKPMYESFAAALLSMGNIHAPIEKACNFFNNKEWKEQVHLTKSLNKKVPGFGSTFCKGEDPIIEEAISQLPVTTIKRIEDMRELVHEVFNPNLYPNAALATAAYAFSNDINPKEAQFLVLQGRLRVWKDIYLANYNDCLNLWD